MFRMHAKQPIPFRGFDQQAPVRIYSHGRLPHWRQDACTYFVTFRLGDALPKNALAEIEYETEFWLARRGIDTNRSDWKSQLSKLSSNLRDRYQKLLSATFDRCLNRGHGECLLREPAIANIVSAALEHFHGTRVLTGNYVVMPNHVHALLTPLPGFELEDLLTSIKGYSARQINLALKRSGNLWQKESYDHIVRDREQLIAYQEYIALNPMKAQLRAGEYIHSTAEYVDIEIS